ncbi:MAG: porin [Candidatus Cyclobacteriaceae bacterium M3_2C_046]
MKSGSIIIWFYLLFTIQPAQAQPFIQPDSLFKQIRPFAMVQLWSVYSFNEKVQLERNTPELEPVQDRMTLYLRRARLGFRGKPYPNLSFLVMFYYDNLGHDQLSASRGGANDGSQFGLWDSFIQWKISSQAEHLYLTAGYFRPQIGRESITSAWAVNSFEKSISQNYLRMHLTGKGNGRTTGINLGGITHRENFGLNYNFGFYNTYRFGDDQATNNLSGGITWSPLLTGRLVFNLGQPEHQTYAISYKVNHFGRRKGASLGISGAYHGPSDRFSARKTAGFDWLINWGPLNLDGEWFRMHSSRPNQTVYSQTGFIRAGYNWILNEKYFLEPALMWSYFYGPSPAEVIDAYNGSDQIFDFGLNWYLNEHKLKINLHYLHQSGSGTNNFYVFQNGRSVQKGDLIGLGVQFII